LLIERLLQDVEYGPVAAGGTLAFDDIRQTRNLELTFAIL